MATASGNNNGVEDTVRAFLAENSGLRYVTREVFWSSYEKIRAYLDNVLLWPLMMSHGLARGSDDIERLTSQSLQPHHRRAALLELAEKGGDHGFMLLFICIHKSSGDSLGHADAVKILQEAG